MKPIHTALGRNSKIKKKPVLDFIKYVILYIAVIKLILIFTYNISTYNKNLRYLIFNVNE